jgi:hypothetical protein
MAFAAVLVGRQAEPWLNALPAHLPWLVPASDQIPATHQGDGDPSTRQRDPAPSEGASQRESEHAELTSDR